MAQSSSDTESEPTVILPESAEAKLEVEEIDLASEIVKEVEERISKSEMEANNLKEVLDEMPEKEEAAELEVQKEPAKVEIAQEEETVVEEVVAPVANDEESPGD